MTDSSSPSLQPRFQKAIERQSRLQLVNAHKTSEISSGGLLTEVVFENLPRAMTQKALQNACLAYGAVLRAGLDAERRGAVVHFERDRDARDCVLGFDLRRDAATGEYIRARRRAPRARR